MTASAMTEAEVRLPRPPGVFRRALAAHPRAVDVIIVVCFCLGATLGIFLDAIAEANSWADPDLGSLEIVERGDAWIATPSYLGGWWAILAVGGLAAVAVALYLRRRYPFVGLIIVLAVSILLSGVVSFAVGVAVLFMLYAVPVYRSVAAGWVGYAVAVIATGLTLFWLPVSELDSAAGVLVFSSNGLTPREAVTNLVGTAIWYLLVVMLAINLGNRRRYLSAIIDRAHQLARERDQLAQLAAAEERSRIAREMHDIVAHSVSVMIALSEGASRALATAPDAAADAMSRSAETGRTALAEMRRLLGALHDTGDEQIDLVPQPGVQDLPELVRSFRDAGVATTLSVSGEDPGDRGQDLAVYRVVQEGLTNVLRYAGTGARAEVAVHRSPQRTVVQVRDFGRRAGTSGPVTGLGSGRGIAGLRERARVLGGVIESGPSDEGAGWLLRAELPVHADARERRSVPPGAASSANAPTVANAQEPSEENEDAT